jgi:cell division protein FtsX
MSPAMVVPSALSIVVGSGTPGVVVSLEDPVEQTTVDRLVSMLEKSDGVDEAIYEDEGATCARFRELFAEQPSLLEGVDCEAIPAVVRVSLNDTDAAPVVVQLVEAEDGVRTVVDQNEGLLGVYQLLQMSNEQREGIAPLFATGTGQEACAPLVQEAAQLRPT